MNIVLLADKKTRKIFEPAVKKNPNITLLGTEMVIRGNTVVRIAEHHNPHAVVIYRNIPEKDGLKVNDLISFLRMKKPNMRIIYVFGELKDNTEFVETAEFLTENDIFDIVTSNNLKDIIQIIENPMTADGVQAILDAIENQEISETEIKNDKSETIDKVFDKLSIDFPSVSALNDFDIERIETISKSINEENRTVIIGIAQLQHHNGCTHTAFEIASMLSKKNGVAIIIADNDTYENFTGFYKLNPVKAKQGLNVKGLDVYPFEAFEQIKSQYNAVVCDFGYLRDYQKKVFADCHIKIMLCSGAEWDMNVILNYINYSNETYTRDINYCFSRISLSKFVKYNKQFIKSGCNAYRLHNSLDWSFPHNDNITAYKDILSPFTIQSSAPKQKRKLIKVK